MKRRGQPWNDDGELFAVTRAELYTAVVGDIMDRLGRQRQFLPPQIRPLRPDMIVAGRAMTVVHSDFIADETSASANPAISKPFGLMLDALDGLRPNEVYICSGASPCYALWGELMSTRAIKCGAVGAVLNGYTRDTIGISALSFPTFSLGPYAQDAAIRGKVVDYRVPIEIGGVRVNPGDIVFGDIDGVCVVPKEIETEVFTKALQKAREEKSVKNAISGGMTAKAAFTKWGIL